MRGCVVSIRGTQAAVTSEGTNNIIITVNYNSGIGRYVEPLQ
jgi:hypothetical protein